MGQDETGERIVAAAAELFAERGYVASTTRAIASKAGVNEVTLFRKFKNKEGILRALVEQGAGAKQSLPPENTIVPGDLEATLRNMAAVEICDAIDNGGLAIRLAFDARSVPEVQAALGDTLASNLERFADYLRSHQAEGSLRRDVDPELMAEAFLSLTSSLVMYRIATGTSALPSKEEIDRLSKSLVGLFWTGAAGHRSERRSGT